MKKIKLVLLLLITISFSCKSQTQKNEDFILEFEKQFFLEGTNVQTIKKYVDIHSEVVKSKNFKEMIQGLVSIGKTRKKLNENFVTKIKVISYDEAGKIEDFREDHFVRKLDYKIKKNVYYIIYPLSKEEVVKGKPFKDKIGGIVIVNNQGKIISFFPYYRNGADPVIPFMLNEKSITDWFGQPFNSL